MGANRFRMKEDSRPSTPDKPWTETAKRVTGALEVDPRRGLDQEEVSRRLRVFGPNLLREAETRPLSEIIVDQFESLVVLLLAAAAALSFLFGGVLEGIAIVVVLVLNAAIGTAAEYRAVTSMEALREMRELDAAVRRNGDVSKAPARDLVPGDVVQIEEGQVITADMRLLESSKLQLNESTLTGESVPVGKSASWRGDSPLAERENMLYKGTWVTRGTGEAVVVSTGMDTEIGRITSLVQAAAEEETPLEVRLEVLGRRLVWVVLLLAAFVAATGVAVGKDVFLIVETSIALAVAAVPEGLPIVATLALARGMWRMARKNALINRLSAVETLGSTNVIITDKTGTLTENRMRLTDVAIHGERVELEDLEGGVPAALSPVPDGLGDLEMAITVGVLCNNASPGKEKVGDPMEVALLEAGRRIGIDREEALERFPELREVSFDPGEKMMATYHALDGDVLVAVKGAPEEVLAASSHFREGGAVEEMGEGTRERWLGQNEELAREGLRVLAVAYKQVDERGAEPYSDLTFVGLVGFLDPAREGVRESILRCREAGLRVVMATGDQPFTARKVAKSLGLDGEGYVLGEELKPPGELSEEEKRRILESNVFARTSPEQKLDIIELHQEAGSIVGMIGDGVNDAPALKKAEIGIAMGKRGTQVAQEASDMVLQDDEFSTIVNAVEQGRTIFNNIRKFVVYLLSCNVSEIAAVGLATVANAPLPILPLQILFLNLITDVFPALALGVGEGGPGTMERPPRDPAEPFLRDDHWRGVAGYGITITLAVLGGLWLALGPLGFDEGRAVTISFLVLAFGQLFHVFNMSEKSSGLFSNEVSRNRWVWGALLVSAGLILLGTYLPRLSAVLKVVDPRPEGWVLVISLSLVPLIMGRVFRLLSGRLGGGPWS